MRAVAESQGWYGISLSMDPGLCTVASSGEPAVTPDVACEPAAALAPADWDTRFCLSATPQMTHQRFRPTEEGPNFHETSDHWSKFSNL